MNFEVLLLVCVALKRIFKTMKKNATEKHLVVPAKLETLLFTDIRSLIESSRQRVATAVNMELNLLYWSVGKRINDEILGDERAKNGKQIVASLARQLTAEFGKGWSERLLVYCVQFAQKFPSKKISHTLCAELNRSQIRLVLPIDNSLKRDFYIEMCKAERWSVRTLRERLQNVFPYANAYG
jgi:hypothetical protein